MKAKAILGAILLSVALCSTSFGGELINRVLGIGCGCDDQCGDCQACAPTKCRPVACAKVGCDVGCETVCKPRWTPVRDVLADLKDLILYKKCRCNGCDVSCGEDCGDACGYSHVTSGDKAPTTAPAKKALKPAPVPQALPIPKPAE